MFLLKTNEQIKENENLPFLICELCIVQANVAYNFKRLALENDFRLRQYLIETGISVLKEDECTTSTNTTTSLEIRQIDVIVDSRTMQFREPVAPPEPLQQAQRRNSVISSVSGATFFGQCSNNRDSTPTSMLHDAQAARFVIPHRPIVRPIQIKVEPEDRPTVVINSSPSTSTSSAITTTSNSNGPTPSSANPNPNNRHPMVVISNSNFQNVSSKHLSGNKGAASTSGQQKSANFSMQSGLVKAAMSTPVKSVEKISKVGFLFVLI